MPDRDLHQTDIMTVEERADAFATEFIAAETEARERIRLAKIAIKYGRAAKSLHEVANRARRACRLRLAIARSYWGIFE